MVAWHEVKVNLGAMKKDIEGRRAMKAILNFSTRANGSTSRLNLAADLAIHQLLRTLLSGDDHVHNIHHVTLSTRNGIEKRAMMEKIEVTLKYKDNMLHLNEIFLRVICIDDSMYQSKVEVQVLQYIAQQLQLLMTKGKDNWLIKCIENEMKRKKYLVLLVDGDAEETLDPQTVGIPLIALNEVAVLITTESQKQASKASITMDLEIWTKDHQ